MADVDQALAAEPGFHDDPAQGGGSVVITVCRLSDHCSELTEQQSENFFALGFGPAATLGVVMEDGAGGAALEAAPGLVIELMDGGFHRQSQV